MAPSASNPPSPLRRPFGLPLWTIVSPFLAVLLLAAGKPDDFILGTAMAIALAAAVMAAVYHAEIIAHRVGEPFGTLILAFAVTVIETSLIVSIMMSDSGETQTLARDTVIAAVMITINGIVGVCLLAGGRRHHEQSYNQSGVNHGLAILATLAVLTLVLPNFTTTEPGPFYDSRQLTFVAVVSLLLYATFVVAQTIRHRGDFLYPDQGDGADHDQPVAARQALAAAVMMVVALVAVVLLAKALSPLIEAKVAQLGAPPATVGIIIAALVLAPEGLAALGAARANRVQKSLNLAIGSALATIGLTIPSVAVASMAMGLDIQLGLSAKSIVLLGLTLVVSTLTLGTGRTTLVQGVVHLVILATWLFTTLVP